LIAPRFSLLLRQVSQRSSLQDKKAKLWALQNQLKESEDKLMDVGRLTLPLSSM
jgi:hypothetical protein